MFKKYDSQSSLDRESGTINMINNLKSTNVALGFVKNSGNDFARDRNAARGKISQQIGSTKDMYNYV